MAKKLVAQKETGIKWEKEFEKFFLDKIKIDILDHPASKKYWVGAKDAGKTRPIIMRDLTYIETDKDAQVIKFKKYIKGGIARLFNSHRNMALEVKRKGYAVNDYVSAQSYGYKLVGKSTKKQVIEYLSLEDTNSIAGIEAVEGGYFASLHIEEPVMFGEKGKVPDKREWDDTVKMILDSIERSNRAYALNNGLNEIPKCVYNASMNAWDDHPLIVETEKYFPEYDFLEFIKQDILNNHTKAVYRKENDTLYIRLTKFSNPIIRAIETLLKQNNINTLEDWESVPNDALEGYSDLLDLGITYEFVKSYLIKEITPLYIKAEDAIRREDKMELARILGLKYDGEYADATYDMSRIKIMDTEKVLNDEKVEIVSMSIGVDVDTRKGRGFWITPVYYVSKRLNIFGDHADNIIIGKQEFIASYGDDERYVELYAKALKGKIQEIIDRSYVYSKGKEFTKMLWIDENRANYLLQMGDLDIARAKAKKHGSWEIKNREDYIQMIMDTGFALFDENNRKLIADMKRTVTKEYENQRDESRTLEKLFDTQNSMEYGLYPFRVSLHQDGLVIGEYDEKQEIDK